jgi:hypothetical protein
VKPIIDGTRFGSITVAGRVYEHDIVIRLDGEVKKRKKKLSKHQTGSSHLVSLDEARHVFEEGATCLIVGTGQHGALTLSKEAEEFFRSESCRVTALPTPEAVEAWNEAEGAAIAMFHVTC